MGSAVLGAVAGSPCLLGPTWRALALFSCETRGALLLSAFGRVCTSKVRFRDYYFLALFFRDSKNPPSRNTVCRGRSVATPDLKEMGSFLKCCPPIWPCIGTVPARPAESRIHEFVPCHRCVWSLSHCSVLTWGRMPRLRTNPAARQGGVRDFAFVCLYMCLWEFLLMYLFFDGHGNYIYLRCMMWRSGEHVSWGMIDAG